ARESGVIGAEAYFGCAQANQWGHRRSPWRGENPRPASEHPPQSHEEIRHHAHIPRKLVVPHEISLPRSSSWRRMPFPTRRASNAQTVSLWLLRQNPFFLLDHGMLFAKRRGNSNTAENSPMLKITQIDGRDSTQTFKLEGKLLEPWLAEV